MPAGLSGGDRIPDTTTLCLKAGDIVVLVSDGFVDSADDTWLQAILAQWDAPSLQSLTAALTDASLRRSGRSDDSSLLVLQMPSLPASAPEAV